MIRHALTAIAVAGSLIGGAHHMVTTAFHKQITHVRVSTYHPDKIKTFTIHKIRVPRLGAK